MSCLVRFPARRGTSVTKHLLGTCILTKKFRAFNDIWIQVFLQSQIKVLQFLSQLWYNCIVVSWVGTPVDTIGAQVVDQVLKEVPARNQATR